MDHMDIDQVLDVPDTMQIMDHMDIDQVLDVPDTPDRLASQNITVQGCLEKQSVSFNFGPSGNGKLFHEESKNQTESSGNVNGRHIHSLRGLSGSGKSGFHGQSLSFYSGVPSSSRNSPLFRKKAAKALNYEKKHSDFPNIWSKKDLFTSQSSACQDRAVADLTECNGHAPVLKKAFPSRVPGVTPAEEFNEGPVQADSCSPYSRANYFLKFNDAYEGRHLVADKVDASPDCMHRVDKFNVAQPNAQKSDMVILSSSTLARGPRQKRLVRNGFISPINKAKGKQPVEKDNCGSIGLDQSCSTGMGQSDSGFVASNASVSQIGARDIVTDYQICARDIVTDYHSHSLKGKGVVNHPFSSIESDVRSTHKSSWNSLSITERASEYGNASRDAFRHFAESDERRTAHTQSWKLNPLMSRQDQHIFGGSFFVSGSNGSRVMREENDNNARTIHENSNGRISDASAQAGGQTSGHLGPQFGENNGLFMGKDALAKRQRQGSTSRDNVAECSSSIADDSDIKILGSSSQMTKSQLTKNQNHTDLGTTESVINIDEVSPEVRPVSSRAISYTGINEDATVTQVELDEMLARELQEQFYNEDPVVGTGEIDAYIALALQQEEESHHTISRGGSDVADPGEWSYHNLPHTGAHAPTSSRMTRLRNRFPGQPRTLLPSRRGNSTILPSRGRNSLFPADVDVNMRMHILEALESLESFSNMGVGSSFLRMQRDFNENDYEMLLALDENNHQHAGASTHQINGLPLSTVQTDNLEEACAVCLETPTMGDIIRHLPCLHKFHKECIDPWLRRRTSCPVCKSSIT